MRILSMPTSKQPQKQPTKQRAKPRVPWETRAV